MNEFLHEILCEEIPAHLQLWALETLQTQLTKRLKTTSLTFSHLQGRVTPKRLAVCLEGLPLCQPERIEERRGPRSDAPSTIIDKFLNATNGTCEQRVLEKGTFWIATILHPGKPTAELLPSIVVETILTFPWPRSMRWGTYTVRWIRPIRGLLAIFAGQPLSGGLPLTSPNLSTDPNILRFCTQTQVNHSTSVTVTNWHDYQIKLKAHNVILSHQARSDSIRTQIETLCASSGLVWKQDDPLVAEVAGLTENPVVLKGQIDPSFMPLPPEVLTQVMRRHQKYFATTTPQGTFSQSFLFVADGTTANTHQTSVIAGNERVLKARLRDAVFFWEQDLKLPLESRLDKLKSVIFHHRLGSMYDKVIRLEALSESLAAQINSLNPQEVKRAALLSKADLVTEMVAEFPELQGIMGSYYALHSADSPAVAQAIRDHYRPLGPQDLCPQAPITLCVALADKIDTLIGFFLINEKPTSSKDPMALRRTALGLLRLILENSLEIPLRPLLDQAARQYTLSPSFEGVIQDVISFLQDRFQIFLRDHHAIRPEIIETLPPSTSFFTLFKQAIALKTFLSTPESENILAAYRRGCHLIEIEEHRDHHTYPPTPQDSLFTNPQEHTLFNALIQTEHTLSSSSFPEALQSLSLLCEPIDRFFDHVLINAPEPEIRINRLHLLSHLRALFHKVADFSRLKNYAA